MRCSVSTETGKLRRLDSFAKVRVTHSLTILATLLVGDNMDSKTNIQVRRSTRDALAELGSKTDTYDDIIVRLINYYIDKGSE